MDTVFATNIIMFFSGLAVSVGLIFTACQVKQSVRATRSNVYQALINHAYDFSKELREQDHLLNLDEEEAEEQNKGKDWVWLFLGIMDFYEAIYIQKELGSLKEEHWTRWDLNMKQMLQRKLFKSIPEIDRIGSIDKQDMWHTPFLDYFNNLRN